jgi:hypothetical protein
LRSLGSAVFSEKKIKILSRFLVLKGIKRHT